MKSNFLFLTFAFQTYTWFCYWFLINFQQNYDLSTIEVEQRKFKPKERQHFFMFKFFCLLICVIPTLTLTIIFVSGNIKGDCNKEVLESTYETMYDWKNYFYLASTSLNILFFSITCPLFFISAYCRQRAMFKDHICKYAI